MSPWQVWESADDVQRAALVALAVATFAQTLFVIVYGSRPWWVSNVGRALFLKSAILCGVLWLTLVNTFWLYPDEEQVGALCLVLLAAAVVYQLVALLRTPRGTYFNRRKP